MRTLKFLLRKEYTQIFRDKFMLRALLLMPVIQLLILSNAATFEVARSRLVVLDQDRSETSRGLISHLVSSGRFVETASPGSMAAADVMMRQRDADAILAVPADFQRDLVRTGHAPAQLILNAEDGAAAGVTLTYARSMVRAYERELLARAGGSDEGGGRGPRPLVGAGRIEVRARGWYNADLDYKAYMVPGILVQLVTVIGTLLTALNIVREKELGTLEQLNVTPITRTEFMIAKLLPLWSFSMVALAIGLAVAYFVFGVPIRGSVVLVFGSAALYLLGALGAGLLISTITETQQQAIFVTFFVLMIYLLMSGLFTPVSSMPAWARTTTQFNPMMHYVAMMRAILVKGAGFADVARSLFILTAFGTVILSLAVWRYRRTSA